LFESESKIYKIFISHTGEYEEEYSIFIQKLSSAHDFKFENFGILENMSDKGFKEQIEPAGIVIILSGLYNRYKQIIKKQLDTARDLDKPIIVIRPYGMENVPLELEEIAEDVVGWNAPCIVDAIEENYLE
jgi:hypothetical protein